MMSTRRQFLQSLSAGGALLALSGRAARADVPAMSKEAQRAMTPEQALTALKEGNERFVNGRMLQRDLIAQVRATDAAQYPFGAVRGSLDSRVRPQVFF